MTRLPDPERSYALLIGNSTYTSAARHLRDLPAVATGVDALRSVLTDPDSGGFAFDHCTVVHDPADVRTAYRALRTHAELAEDTLLIYWAGHGRPGPMNELHLAVRDTDPADLPVSALAVGLLRDLVRNSRAVNRILLLDSCFSGRALPDMAGAAAAAAQIAVEGAYALVSAPPNSVSLAPAGERYTAFTGALLELLRQGIPGGPELLTMDAVFPRLRQSLTARGLPQPQQHGTGTVTRLALVRNPAYEPLPEEDEPPTRRMSRRRLLAAAALGTAAVSGATVGARLLWDRGPSTRGNAAGQTATTTADPTKGMSRPLSVLLDTPPADLADPSARRRTTDKLLGEVNDVVGHPPYAGRKVGFVRVIALGPSRGAGQDDDNAAAAARLLSILQDQSPAFAGARGEAFWGRGPREQFSLAVYFLA